VVIRVTVRSEANAVDARVTRAAFVTSLVTALSRVIGFGRVLVVTAILGTTYLGNTYLGANSLSNVAFELLAAGALSAVLVPTFVRMLARGEDDGLRRLVGGLATVVALGLGVVSVLAIVAAPRIGEALAAGAPDTATEDAQRELGTFLVRWFAPQVVLYGLGAIAAAVLHARRRFALVAAAPIASTVVMITALVGFRVAAGSSPALALDAADRWWLALAGTGGVIGFVGILVVGAARAGVGVMPRSIRRAEGLRELLGHSGWGVLLHSIAGGLLGVAILRGNAVEGGVVAYQAAFVFFLAPYAILAQPLQSAMLPELTEAVDRRRAALDLGWATRRTVVLTAPIAAVLTALAGPTMGVLTIGEIDRAGVTLIAGALAGLAVGLVPYCLFLLFARAHYAAGDSRTPAITAIVGLAVGATVMIIGTEASAGTAAIGWLGLGHSIGYLVAAALLAGTLARGGLLRRIDLQSCVPAATGAVAVGLGAWLATRAIAANTPVTAAGVAGVAGAIALGVYVATVGRSGRRGHDGEAG
jgi:putative peptidoglycan lipid II flippase